MNQPGKTDAPAPSGPPQDAHPARRRRPSRWPYAVALVAALGVVGTAWLSRKHFEPIIAGVAAPSFTVSTMEGQPVGLDSYPGKVVLLNVWATWCVPCETEMPSMQRLYADLSDEGFEILAVSVDAPEDGKPPVKTLDAFVRKHSLTFPILYSEPGSAGSIQQIFQTAGVPESFLIGKDGVIYRRIAGPTEWDSPQYREQILRLLGE